MIRYICDGCDMSLRVNDEVEVGLKLTVGGPLCMEAYHLCSSCKDKLKKDANPSNWHRVAKA